MQNLQEQLKTKLELTDEQIEALLTKFNEQIVWKALSATKFKNKEIFKMNLRIFSKYGLHR